MTVLYETNGKGFLGWITDYPGAYIRGKTLEEARSKIDNEIKEYGEWINEVIRNGEIGHEKILQSSLMIEDADSDAIFDNEKEEYETKERFEKECEWALISARKVEEIYMSCMDKDSIDKTMIRKTFYGDVYCTIGTQYKHIVDVQQYYLDQIGCKANIEMNIVDGRGNTLNEIKYKYIKEGNALYKYPQEEWTIRKVIRRLIWHDRIHAKAIKRMSIRIGRW